VAEERVRIIEIFCVTTFRVAAATGGSGNFLISSKEMLVAIALLLLIGAAALAWQSHKKLIQTCSQNRAEIDRLQRLCSENQQRLNRMMASLPTEVGQETLFNRVRQALATSYARTQTRLVALEAIDLNAMRIDISQLQADYASIQDALQTVFQEFNRVHLLEQYVMQLQMNETVHIPPPVDEKPLYLLLEQEINNLRNHLATLPIDGVNDMRMRLDGLERTLMSFEKRLTEFDQRLTPTSMLLANAIPLANSDELKVLQVLKQKIQEPETILYPDQSFELPTGMGVEMRFKKLIKRADAIALCDKLARLPDLQVPSATVSWVRSRFLIGIRGLETIVYRNRYGGTDRYILLHEALQLVDELIREFETNHWRSLDST
jgi:hypothetical protein